MKKLVYVLLTFYFSLFTFDVYAQTTQEWAARYQRAPNSSGLLNSLKTLGFEEMQLGIEF